MDKQALRKKFDDVAQLFNNQSGIQSHFIDEKTRLLTEIAEHNEFLDSKESVQKVLHELQRRTQSRTKDIYENLLTSLVKDVMPDNAEADRVILNTSVKNNKTALSVEVANKEGYPRDVYMDKGGSIENIIAMGLRFIALSRTSNRRFIILDEADAWLKDIYVPAFAEVLCQLSKRVGIQVVYISHHSVENFIGKAKIINLVSDNGKIVAEDFAYENDGEFEGVDDKNLPDLMEGVGIRYLRLVNFKQHENTLLELSPNVTIITGDNDIGKTTVLQAIEAVNQNLGRDGLIRDDQPYCRVEFGLEDDMTLSWTYRRKALKKTSYVLTDDENKDVKVSNSGTEVPEWLHDYLAMGLYHEFDLHIGDQHNASFILDKKVSAHKRAEILSLGKEASKVQKMITLHSDKIKMNTQELNRKQKELNAVKNKLAILRELGALEEKLSFSGKTIVALDAYDDALMDIESKAKAISRLSRVEDILKASVNQALLSPLQAEEEKAIESTLSRLENLEGKLNILSEALNLPALQKIEYIELSSLEHSISSIDTLYRKLGILEPVINMQLMNRIEVENLEDMRIKGVQAAKILERLQILSSVFQVKEIEVLSEASDLENDKIFLAGTKAVELKNKKHQIAKNLGAMNEELSAIDSELSEQIDAIGGVCPTCSGQFNHKHTLGVCA